MKCKWKKKQLSSALAMLLSSTLVFQAGFPVFAEENTSTEAIQDVAADVQAAEPSDVSVTGEIAEPVTDTEADSEDDVELVNVLEADPAGETASDEEGEVIIEGDAAEPQALGSYGDVSAADTSDLVVETLDDIVTGEQTYIPEDGILADNDELTEGYLASVLGISNAAATVGNYGESDLTGLDATIYELLKEKVSDVAAATSSTSTSFTFSASELGLTTGTYYTAEELGVDSLGTYSNGTTSLTDGVEDALMEKLGATFDLDNIMKLLCVNCPYELYWYDKTTGTNAASAIRYGFSRYSSGEIVEIAVATYNLTISMTVASDYQDSTSTTAQYTVSGATSATVQKAKTTAETIVENNAGATDYNRLLEYKDQICELVSYNSNAASSSYTGGYGDPWQIIYVFDGDSSTNVVCEGYSKAFQYLCDLTDFSDAVCYTVTGTLSGGTGSGGHMWNIVTMEDEKNYLVDVTNSDSTAVGKGGELFLAGTSGTITAGYSFTIGSSTVGYVYNSDAKELYGTGDDSILNLAASNYTPGTTLSTPSADDFTFTAPAGLTYDGTAKEASVISNEEGMGKVTVKYYDEDGNEVNNAINAGTYTVKIDVAEGDSYTAATDLTDNTWKFTIKKATPDPGTVSVDETQTIYEDTALEDIVLSRTDETVAGILALEEGQTLSAGTNSYNWIFTPTDTENYNTASGTVEITVLQRAVAVLGHSLTLSGDIGVNFYIYLTDEIKSSTAAYVEFTVDGKTSTVMVSDAVAAGKTYTNTDGLTGYRFQCFVNSTQMSQDVTAKLYDGESSEALLTDSYAVNKYGYDTSNTTLAAMIEAMLNYGAYAQTYFNAYTDNLATTPSTMVTLSATSLSGYAISTKKNPATGEIRCYGISLVLDSTTSIYYYIQADKLEGYTVYLDDVQVTPETKSPLGDSLQALDSMYYVKAGNIAANNLDVTHTLKITDSAGETVVEIRYSAYSYIYSKLKNSSTDTALQNLVTALYYYGEATEAYAASVSAAKG